jgi:hypothetical protein
MSVKQGAEKNYAAVHNPEEPAGRAVVRHNLNYDLYIDEFQNFGT